MSFNKDVRIGILVQDDGKFCDVILRSRLEIGCIRFEQNAGFKCDLDSFPNALNFCALDVLLHLTHPGPNVFACDARFRKGDEMGWFHLGSTIIVFAPRGFELAPGVAAGQTIKMGQPLLRLPPR